MQITDNKFTRREEENLRSGDEVMMMTSLHRSDLLMRTAGDIRTGSSRKQKHGDKYLWEESHVKVIRPCFGTSGPPQTPAEQGLLGKLPAGGHSSMTTLVLMVPSEKHLPVKPVYSKRKCHHAEGSESGTSWFPPTAN